MPFQEEIGEEENSLREKYREKSVELRKLQAKVMVSYILR